MTKSVPAELERFVPQHPTVIERPLPAVDTKRVPCGICQHWSRFGRTAFGQCIKAQQALGATLYRSDLDSCSMGQVDKL